MKKKKKPFTIANIFMMFAIVILLVVSTNLFSTNREVVKINKKLEMELASEKEHAKLHGLTNEFIYNLSTGNGNVYEMLSENAKQKFDEALEQEGYDNHDHSHNLLEKLEINNIYAVKTGLNSGKSYAIYRTYYGIYDDIDTPIQQQQILTLSIKIDWVKENNEYKVEDYEFQLLKDSLDSYMQELNNKEGDSN